MICAAYQSQTSPVIPAAGGRSYTCSGQATATCGNPPAGPHPPRCRQSDWSHGVSLLPVAGWTCCCTSESGGGGRRPSSHKSAGEQRQFWSMSHSPRGQMQNWSHPLLSLSFFLKARAAHCVSVTTTTFAIAFQNVSHRLQLQKKKIALFKTESEATVFF